MPDPTLTEIGHLFLSSIRERGGAQRPQRRPPGPPRADATIDLTPEEYASVAADRIEQSPAKSVAIPPISAVIASHFSGDCAQRVRQYARHLASGNQRVGMIEVDAGEFRVSCFDGSAYGEISVEAAQPTETFNPKEMAQAIEEMSCDVNRWLLVLPNPRLLEARNLLAHVDRWTMLCTCDHESVVSCYKVLKSLAEVNRPALSLALLDVTDEAEAARVFEKLAGVCRQFLDLPVQSEPHARAAEHVDEHVAMHCHKPGDAPAPQWQLMTDFLVRAKLASGALQEPEYIEKSPSKNTQPAPVAPAESESVMPQHINEQPTNAPAVENISDVIDVPADATESDILAAIVRHAGNEMIECPVAPPMCPSAKLAITRDRRIAMIAIARAGLSDLMDIGLAYRWLIDNRQLICMALPQFSIDPHSMPQLNLFVNQSDAAADTLQPLLQSGHIAIRAYRKLRWGDKTGLLLEAA